MAKEVQVIFNVRSEEAAQKLREVTSSLDNVTEHTKKATGNFGNANNQLLSLNRIIQDLPYGFSAISNNITFMAEQMGYAAGQGIRLKDQFKALLTSLAGTGGLIFAISAAVSIITILGKEMGGTSGAARDLTKELKDMWSKTFNLTEQWKLFYDEIKKFTEAQTLESIRAIREEMDKLTGFWTIAKLSLAKIVGLDSGMMQDILERKMELQKMLDSLEEMLKPTEASRIGRKPVPSTLPNIEPPDEKVISGFEAIRDILAESRKIMMGITGQRAYGPAGPADQFAGAFAGQIKRDFELINDLVKATSDTMRSVFIDAWRDIFGEANSLLEKFAASLADVFLQRAAGGITNWLAGLLFPAFGAAGAIFGAAPVKQPINIYIGDKTVAQVVVDANRTAEKLRLS